MVRLAWPEMPMRVTFAMPSSSDGTKASALLPPTVNSTAPEEGPNSTFELAGMMLAANVTCSVAMSPQLCLWLHMHVTYRACCWQRA